MKKKQVCHDRLRSRRAYADQENALGTAKTDKDDCFECAPRRVEVRSLDGETAFPNARWPTQCDKPMFARQA